jgi:hypothetical protein
LTRAWDGSSGGVDWVLELARDGLLPGRLVDGRVRLTARHPIEARRLLVTLRGREHWRYDETTTDSNGTTHTETHTGTEDLPPEPVLLAEPVALAAGETREAAFQLPVPSLGPPSVIAEEAGVEWTVEAKLDVAGGRDSSLTVPVRVLQPVSLLRAGVVPVAEFALYPAADAGDGGIQASIALDPVPLCAAVPFTGRVVLRSAGSLRVRGVRAALLITAKATVGGGRQQTITGWSGLLAGSGSIQGEQGFDLAGSIDPDAPPTTELRHGRVSARFEVTLDRAWAPDTHLGRDVAIASTLEL